MIKYVCDICGYESADCSLNWSTLDFLRIDSGKCQLGFSAFKYNHICNFCTGRISDAIRKTVKQIHDEVKK